MNLGFLNIGTQEMVLIVIVILLLFGGKKLPELARGLGRGIREFKDASDGIKQEISDQINNFEKDLDVTVEDKPATKTKSQTIAEEMNQRGEEASTTETEEETKKEFPTFTTPEHSIQHHPGEQPASDEEHYTYGYDDHFANEEESAGVASENTDTTETDAETETETNTDTSEGEQPKKV